MGADLDLHRTSVRADHGGVQRLIHVELGHRDVVLEPPREGAPLRMQHPEGGITLTHRVHEHAGGLEIVDLIEILTPHDHLLIDRVVVLGAAGDRGVNAGLVQFLGNQPADRGQVPFAFGRAFPHHTDDFFIDLGVEGGKGKILQLPLDRVHAQAMCERREDLQRFARLFGGGRRGHEPPRSCVVQPVRELDHEHADVLGHGHDHFAYGLCLGVLAVLDLVQLGHTVHEHGDLFTEVLGELLQRVVGVLHGVMQKTRHQGRARHAQFGEDRGDRHRVSDVGIPGLALLSLMIEISHGERAFQDIQVLIRMRGAHAAQQRDQDGRAGHGLTRQGRERGPGAFATSREHGPAENRAGSRQDEMGSRRFNPGTGGHR